MFLKCLNLLNQKVWIAIVLGWAGKSFEGFMPPNYKIKWHNLYVLFQHNHFLYCPKIAALHYRKIHSWWNHFTESVFPILSNLMIILHLVYILLNCKHYGNHNPIFHAIKKALWFSNILDIILVTVVLKVSIFDFLWKFWFPYWMVTEKTGWLFSPNLVCERDKCFV